MLKIFLFLFFFSLCLNAGWASVYSTIILQGNALENGNEVIMHADKKGRFVAYQSLIPGDLIIEAKDLQGNSSVLSCDDFGYLVENGETSKININGLTRLILDPNKKTLDFYPINYISLKGSIVPQNTYIEYEGNGCWHSTLTLDKPTDNEYKYRNFYFTINGDEKLSIKRIGSSSTVGLMEEGDENLENIRLNRGEYDITLNLNDYSLAISQEIDPLKISVFGSSVANGQGADYLEGYAFLYGKLLRERFESGTSSNALYTSGVSIGGNTTVDLKNRYLDVINDFGKFVVLGLSMGNEGLHGTSNKQAIYTQFKENLLYLITKLQNDNKIPIIVNNYPRGDFNEQDYEKIRDINLDIHEWNIPSINSLGAIDNGKGRLVQAFKADNVHPNNNGHRELMYSIVPSLFDALIIEKPVPERDLGGDYLLHEGETITFTPEEIFHPFTLCLRVKSDRASKLISFNSNSDKLTGVGSLFLDSEGRIHYTSPHKEKEFISQIGIFDDNWHDIALSHYYARELTIIYVDGKEIGSISETLEINGDIGIGNENEVDQNFHISEITFWRAGMNQDEMQAHHMGKMLKSSLEIYSPMYLIDNQSIMNYAQSMNTLTLNIKSGINYFRGDSIDPKIETGPGFAIFYGDSIKINIFSMAGQLVKTVTTSLNGTEVKLSPGLYIVNDRKFLIK